MFFSTSFAFNIHTVINLQCLRSETFLCDIFDREWSQNKVLQLKMLARISLYTFPCAKQLCRLHAVSQFRAMCFDLHRISSDHTFVYVLSELHICASCFFEISKIFFTVLQIWLLLVKFPSRPRCLTQLCHLTLGVGLLLVIYCAQVISKYLPHLYII